MTTPVRPKHHVGCARLADGVVIELSGVLTDEELPALRELLLSPLPADCNDVVVDAGGVRKMDDGVLAVLLAACAWVESQGGRFLLSRTSKSFDRTLAATGLADDLPRLSELPGSRPGADAASAGDGRIHIPYPRVAL